MTKDETIATLVETNAELTRALVAATATTENAVEDDDDDDDDDAVEVERCKCGDWFVPFYASCCPKCTAHEVLDEVAHQLSVGLSGSMSRQQKRDAVAKEILALKTKVIALTKDFEDLGAVARTVQGVRHENDRLKIKVANLEGDLARERAENARLETARSGAVSSCMSIERERANAVSSLIGAECAAKDAEKRHGELIDAVGEVAHAAGIAWPDADVPTALGVLAKVRDRMKNEDPPLPPPPFAKAKCSSCASLIDPAKTCIEDGKCADCMRSDNE